MMDFSKFKKLTIGGVELKQLFINGIQVWKSGYKNWVKYSTEADGVTIYNGGLGYKDGYRIRSGGAESAQYYGTITGFIPFKKGDVLRIYPKFTGQNTINTINFADSNFGNLGQINDSGAAYGICATNRDNYLTQVIDGVSTLTYGDSIDQSIRYIRITHFILDNAGVQSEIKSGSEMIVTINEEIE